VNFAIVIFLRWIIQKPLLRRRNEIHCGIYSCRFPQQHLAGSTILKLENARVRSCDRATILYSSSHHRGISVFAAQLAITVALAAVPHRRRRRQRQRRARRRQGGAGPDTRSISNRANMLYTSTSLYIYIRDPPVLLSLFSRPAVRLSAGGAILYAASSYAVNTPLLPSLSLSLRASQRHAAGSSGAELILRDALISPPLSLSSPNRMEWIFNYAAIKDA